MAEAETLTAGNGTPEIRLIISDFGGVICTFDYRIFCDRLARRTGRTTDQVFAAAFGDHLQREFETGRLSGPEITFLDGTFAKSDIFSLDAFESDKLLLTTIMSG